ncbi:RNA-directed DNA polymerase, eukaryota, reverse transcriptase zinc-binding domain protein [Tanacetum coccineum]
MWKAKSLSFGGRLTLIKAILGSLGVYYFSIFKDPKCILTKLKCIRRKFFWGGFSDFNKIPWIAWDKFIAPFDKGGLNIGCLKNWRRPLRPCDLTELAELQSLLSNFRITSLEDDHWEFLLDITRSFTINIASWRMENRRIPTRVYLDHIGIDLDSVRCPVCDNDLETEDHILVKCEVAASV